MMGKSSRYSQFPPLSTEEWEAVIKAETRNENGIEDLSWVSPEGVKVKPFYHWDTYQALPYKPQFPSWEIGGYYTMHQLSQFNDPGQLSRSGIERIILESAGDLVDISLDNLELPLHWELNLLPSTLDFLSANFPKVLPVHLHFDPIGNLAASGNWYENEQYNWAKLKEVINSTEANSYLAVDTGLYQNAGANRVQQLGYALAHAYEYIKFLKENQLRQEAFTLVFKVAVDSDYFLEISKIRALRWLWDSLLKHSEIAATCIILAEPSMRNKSVLDYNVNMIRTTTEIMAGVLGGADVVCNHSYDHIYNERNEFGDRIALNQLLILKHEAHFNSLSNLTQGAYYMDHLTRDLAGKGLERFKSIEASGGFIEGLKLGRIQQEIRESARSEEAAFQAGKRVILGAQIDNEEYELPPAMDIKLSEKKEIAEKNEVTPIIPTRIAAAIEKSILSNG